MKNKLILIFILIFALFIRAYSLNSYPSLNPDEASLGYNAYVLLLTGKDEHGQSWPLHFMSFGDFKPGGYVYLSLPFVWLLGLSPLAVRLPNLILSLLTIFVLYRLVKLLTRHELTSLVAAFVLTVSPWHIHFSRGAWESSSATFFILLGTYYLYSYIQKNRLSSLYFSVISFSTSVYLYHSARIISPILALTIIILNYSLFIKNYKKLLFPTVLAILLILPVLTSFLTSGGLTRFGGVGFTADKGPLNRSEELLNHHSNTLLVNRLIHNRRLLYFLSWVQKYSSHFDFNYLFLKGDEVPRSRSPDMGQFYLFDLPFVIAGLYLIFRQKNRHLLQCTLALLLISPLASSLTFQAPSALRSLPLVLPVSTFIALGYTFIITKFKKNVIIFLAFILAYSIGYFFDAYFIHSQKRYPFAWNTSFPQAISYLQQHAPSSKYLYFTTKYDQPYILYLFYTRYPPQQLQSQIRLTTPDQFGFSTVNQIDNLTFGIPPWDKIPQDSLVIAADEFPTINPHDVINFPNGQPGFKIYQK